MTCSACLTSDGGSTDGGSCPGAQELYDYAAGLHREAQEKLHFGSTWEITYQTTVYRPPHYYRYPQLVSGPPDDEVVGAREYTGTTKLLFTVPSGPTPLSCSDVQEIRDSMTEAPDMVRDVIELEYMFRFMDAFPLQGIAVTGSGTHRSREYPSFVTDRVVNFTLLACPFDNPCAQDRTETLGCSVPSTLHTVDARVVFDWYPGEAANVSTDIVSFFPQGSNGTQVKRYGNPDYEYIGVSPDLCDSFRAICPLGTTTVDVACGMAYQEFDRGFSGAPDIPLLHGQQQNYSVTDSGGEVRTRTVSLECLDGCECVVASDCDDGKVCTRDSCNAGNCVNTPDDLIEPEQVENDCRSCENGEVVSMRQQAERECDLAKSNTVETCSTSDNWLVHWVKEFGGPAEIAHLCQSGTVPGDSALTICDGQGQCSIGQPTTFLEGMIDRSCQNYAGQHVQLTCDVFCTRCE